MSRYRKTTISKSVDVDVDIDMDDVEEFLSQCDADEIESVIKLISENDTNLTANTLTYINNLLEANDESIAVDIEKVLDYIDKNIDKAEYQLILNRIRANVEDNDIELKTSLPNTDTPTVSPVSPEMIVEYIKNTENDVTLQTLGMLITSKLYEIYANKHK